MPSSHCKKALTLAVVNKLTIAETLVRRYRQIFGADAVSRIVGLQLYSVAEDVVSILGFRATIGGLAVSLYCSCAPRKTAPSPPSIAEPMIVAGWLTFKPAARLDPRTLFRDHASFFRLPAGNDMRLREETTDELGIAHFRYLQFFRGLEVENAELRVRARDNTALGANGRYAFDFLPTLPETHLSEAEALKVIESQFPAARYFREDDLVSDLWAAPSDPPNRPRGTLLFSEDPTTTDHVRRLSWRFKVYRAPLEDSRQAYVDAVTGAVFKELPLLAPCALGSGQITFRGSRRMNTRQRDGAFFLEDDCDGNLLSATLLDSDNKPLNVNDPDNDWTANSPSLVTSYWGLRACYDYFDLIHGQKSFDGKNGSISIFNVPAMDNGGHGASGGSGVIRIGLAQPGDNDDYNTLDIVGHEFTHNVIENTARLSYDVSKESAALNESFSDIFGQMVEQWIEGSASKEWVIGDDKGCAAPYVCRDLYNPKAFSDPDTYKGTFWQSGAKPDPHANGSVQNRWFALLSDGGTGTNMELASAYSVNGVGPANARQIAFRTLQRYLHADSGYADARLGSIMAAGDLFGEGSPQQQSVTKAWCAVGLCPYVIPKQRDRFDRPNGNPNPASPNNNDSQAAATPIGSPVSAVLHGQTFPWTLGPAPRLNFSELSIYPGGDRDYFQVTRPEVNSLSGRCFSSGFAFDFGAPVNVNLFSEGRPTRSFVEASSFTVDMISGPILLEIVAPFPGQILSYKLSIAFFLHYKSDCFQPGPSMGLDAVRECPMCDARVLEGLERVVLDPFERQPGLITTNDHYFPWSGQGPLSASLNMLAGNNLHVELVDHGGRRVASADRTGKGEFLLTAPEAPPGVYSFRFSQFGNGTEVLVNTPGH